MLGDRDRLHHAVRNVVENAIAFSPRGATVWVTTGVRGRAARLTVRDEGPGVPPEHRERVFERFFRVDPSRSRATGGSGLGLAIVRDVVAAHGGVAWVQDGAPGAVVAIELPATAPELRDPPSKPSGAAVAFGA